MFAGHTLRRSLSVTALIVALWIAIVQNTLTFHRTNTLTWSTGFLIRCRNYSTLRKFAKKKEKKEFL